jgi:hypothetical protein
MNASQNQREIDNAAEDEARAEQIGEEIAEAILEGEDYTLVISSILNDAWQIDCVFVAEWMIETDGELTYKHVVYPSKDTTQKMGVLLAKVIEEIVEAAPLLKAAQYERTNK